MSFKNLLKLFRNRIVVISIKFFVKINSPYLVALVLFLLSGRYSDKKKYQVLYLSKPVFNHDVDSISEISDRIIFKKFPRLCLSIICKLFIKDFDKLNDANYHLFVKKSKNIYELRDFLNKVMVVYKRFNHFDAVLSGNFVYTQIQELFIVLKSQSIPSIVLYKEGMLPISKFNLAKDFLYKTKVFRSDHIMFYNNFIRKTLVETNMPGLTFSKTSVIGLPRFDKYFRNGFKNESNQITLFSFEPNEKSYLLDKKVNFTKFNNYVKKFHLLFADFCLKNNEYNLIVKTKGSDRASEYAKNIFSDYKDKLGGRLSISSSIPAYELIKSSEFIAGFSSTTLIEGLALNKKIICPKFPNSVISKKNDLLHPYQNLANYVIKGSELSLVFKQSKPIDENLRKKFINERVYRFDGQSSLRAERCIIKVIENFKSND